MRIVRLVLLALIAVGCAPFAVGEGQGASAVVAEFTNPALIPAHWTLTLFRNGRGSFHSERGNTKANDSAELDAPNVDRDFEVTPEFAQQVFKTAWGHKWFNEECESHMKVAFQGWKKISYAGPDGKGSCTFNYSKDKEIQTLADALTGLAATLIEGGRLESLLQHDRLGLDREMEFIAEALKDGRMRQLGAIREILERLEEDPAVLDRVRKRARTMLAQTGR